MAETDRLPMSEMLALARESNPDLWERIDGVARIIDPGAFAEGYVVWPEENARTFEARQKYMRAVARHKAHEVLSYLGINTDTDWLYILERMGRPEQAGAQPAVPPADRASEFYGQEPPAVSSGGSDKPGPVDRPSDLSRSALAEAEPAGADHFGTDFAVSGHSPDGSGSASGGWLCGAPIRRPNGYIRKLCENPASTDGVRCHVHTDA